MLRSLKDDLTIHNHNLARDWEEQPELYRYWAEEYAHATLQRDIAKERLDLLVADLDLAIRADPEKYGISKLTESVVSSAIKTQQGYQDQIDVLNQAKYLVTRMNAAREAMIHKKDALKELTSLSLAGFYSANTAPPETHIEKGKALRKAFASEQAAKQQKRMIIK